MAIQFNLLPWREQLRTQRRKYNRILLVSAVFCGLFCSALLYGYAYYVLQNEQQELSIIAEKNKQLLPLLREKNQLDTLAKDIDGQLSDIAALESNATVIARLLESITVANDQKLFFSDMYIGYDQMYLLGKASDDKQIADFMQKLSDDGLVQNLKLIEITTDIHKEKRFKITGRVQFLPLNNSLYNTSDNTSNSRGEEQ